MKVLVTGANGFVGRHICNHLADYDKYNVYGMVRSKTDSSEGIEYIHTNLSDKGMCKQLLAICGEIDVIVHAAACLSKDNRDAELINTNCQGMLNLVEAAHSLRCRRFVYISSLPVIGRPYILPVTEEHPTAPETTYHATKLFGEHILLLQENSTLNPVLLRLPSPIGNGMRQKTILTVFLENCLAGKDIVLHGKGTRKQNYIDVRDICRAIELSLTYNACGVYNIAGRKSISNYELAETCIRLTGTSSSILFNNMDDPQEGIDWDISIKKACEDFAFEPIYSIDDSIKRILDTNRDSYDY